MELLCKICCSERCGYAANRSERHVNGGVEAVLSRMNVNPEGFAELDINTAVRRCNRFYAVVMWLSDDVLCELKFAVAA